MTVYHLATQGTKDEDLFGILACALCLISRGFDPSKTADISVTALLDIDAPPGCNHEKLTAAGLAGKILAQGIVKLWSAKLQSGWNVLFGVLYRCEKAHGKLDDDERRESNAADYRDNSSKMTDSSPDQQDVNCYIDDFEPALYFQRQKDLSTLWASVQAELLSYRRLDNDHDWLSKDFSMDAIQEQLNQNEDLAVGYSRRNLLRAHCVCHGDFGDFNDVDLVPLSRAIDPDLANLDIWGRATYSNIPDGA
jgi:hypothetical protein